MAVVDFANGRKRTLYNTAIADLGNGVTITVVDSDTAASVGTPVYIVATADGVTGYLESTTAGNADSIIKDASGNILQVNDSDAPGGVLLYFDENATLVDERFMHVSPVGTDVLVPLSDGSQLKVVHDAAAATVGVAVYFDDNAANAALALFFVSPTNTNGAGITDRGDVDSKVNAILAALRLAGVITT